MKRVWAILLLSGCGSDPAPAPPPRQNDAAMDAAVAAVAVADGTETPAQIQAKAIAAMRVVLADPDSAQLADLRAGPLGSVCGKVDTRRANGRRSGFLPFVVTPQGAASISETDQIGFGDPADPFPDQYIRWCASPEEMDAIASRVTSAASGLPRDMTIDPDALPPEPEAAPAAPVAPIPEPSARPPAPPRQATGDGSFYDAVLRPAEANQQ